MTDPTPEEIADEKEGEAYEISGMNTLKDISDHLDKVRCTAVKAERKEWHALIAVMMRALPWGALKGALLEDSRVKDAIREEPS